ncbi:polysaccharide lyase family 7 protein [Catenovulum sp. 2E275]|uniref:polysaccharide lyase family 7 protein n=1 Tax=Catenovulum sp. 2E275 TaxID=2980497 RepID=UPI0021D23113|nr:polysaccharide lyase family 7 protein [Catenovulum sp. 2E275]MCU4674025.1 polysaccharide lyase family 7 protein [Catenovulum sp. 2E275]
MKLINNMLFCALITPILFGCNTQKSDPPKETENQPAITNCTQVYPLRIISATSISYEQQYPAKLTIDNNFSDDSRWTSTAITPSLILDLGEDSLLHSIDLSWYLADKNIYYFEILTSLNKTEWDLQLTNQTSNLNTNRFENTILTPHYARYIKLTGLQNIQTSLKEIKVNGCNSSGSAPWFNLNPAVAPSGNFDLLDWSLSIPTDQDNNGRADHIYETELANDYTHPEYFYTATDGAMVFRAPINGFKTSTNTSYTRSELREMLRRGQNNINTQGISKNNWGFSTYSEAVKPLYGGIDGMLTATLKIDHVTTTGDDYQIGRVIIGQIHASDDEPARLYYRKLPNNSKGSIYLVHEPLGGDDIYYEMIGNRSNIANNPLDGIELGEVFSYTIQVSGHELIVTISRAGKPDVIQTVDISNSGYHLANNEYMYFKAGAYNQNNSGDETDYVQVSFYYLDNQHTGYHY